jgi:hypothetical protein
MTNDDGQAPEGPPVDREYLVRLESDGAPPMDDNDRHRAGLLPDDPFEGTEPVQAPDDGPDDGAPRQVSIADLVGPALAKMRARATGEDRPVPLPSTWPKVAQALGGGLWPGLHVLVGNTGSGKSQWALQAAIHAARQGTPVLYIGLELGEVDLVARCLAMLYDEVDRHDRPPHWSTLFLGQDPELLERFADKAAKRLETLPIAFEVAGPFGWPAGRLVAAVEELRERWPSLASSPPLVVLDYLQVIGDEPGKGKPLEIRERIARAAYQGRTVARDCDAAVLLVSSTARDNYARLYGDGKPWDRPASELVGLGKESGEIEFSADSVLAMVKEPWRERDNDGQPRPPHDGSHIHLAVAKVRAGRETWCPMRFDGASFWEPREDRHTARPVGWVPVPTKGGKTLQEVALTVSDDGRLAVLIKQGAKEKERPLYVGGSEEGGGLAGLTRLAEWSRLDLLPALVGNAEKVVRWTPPGTAGADEPARF